MFGKMHILKKISFALGLAVLAMGCDTRGTGVGAATGGKDEVEGERTLEERTGTAAAIVGRPDDQRVLYVLSELDHVANHEGIRLILAERILFEPNDATLKEDAREKLEEVSDLLKYYAPDPIKISGHADDKGDPNRNKELSKQRAEAVKQYLVQNFNIDASRIETVGYGNEMPISGQDSRTSGEYAGKDRENRRVEIKVVTTRGTPPLNGQQEANAGN